MIDSGRCHLHSERMGVGVCVECRRVICQECTTPFEGINRCADCLRRRLAALGSSRKVAEWGVGNVLLTLVAVLGLWGLVYVVARGLS